LRHIGTLLLKIWQTNPFKQDLNASNSSCTAVIPQNKEKFKKNATRRLWSLFGHRCKKTFLRFFGHVRFFTFFNVFSYSKRFLFKKNVGKVQSGKQINKKHFQNNNNEIDL